jgi:hypothetical protein
LKCDNIWGFFDEWRNPAHPNGRSFYGLTQPRTNAGLSKDSKALAPPFGTAHMVYPSKTRRRKTDSTLPVPSSNSYQRNMYNTDEIGTVLSILGSPRLSMAIVSWSGSPGRYIYRDRERERSWHAAEELCPSSPGHVRDNMSKTDKTHPGFACIKMEVKYPVVIGRAG